MPAAPARREAPPVSDPPLLRAARDEAGVLTLTLASPARRNALSGAMMAALQSALDEAATDGETRVIVLDHDGPAFSAGHDLHELNAARAAPDRGRDRFTELMLQCAALMQSVVRHPRPVIALVDGIATAAGCQLVASCDLAFCSPASRFATPGVKIGLFCSTPMLALSRNVARKHAMEMLLTGDFADAARAAEIGLVNRVVPAEALRGEVTRVARQIAGKSLMTVHTGKQAFYEQADMALSDAYAFTAEVMIDNMLKADAVEGVAAFLDKREPRWTDR